MQSRSAFVIPAYQAGASLALVVAELREALREAGTDAPIVVVDDGSTDDTASIAEELGVILLRHERNRGKGAALVTALEWAERNGHASVVSLDADGQHPGREAVRLLGHPCPEDHLLLGVRDLARARAPLANQRSNRFSNQVLSLLGGAHLDDTQCGLRRYPVKKTLALRVPWKGFAFESDAVLRAARRGTPMLTFEPTEVRYPPEGERVTHFDSVRDPTRIVGAVVWTSLTVPHHRWYRRWPARALKFAIASMVLLFGLHLALRAASALSPPPISLTETPLEHRTGKAETPILVSGASFAERSSGVWKVRLMGTPERIGWSHAQLLRDDMVENESRLFSALERYVPSRLVRSVVVDLGALRFLGVDRGMDEARLRELAAGARAFSPDPFASFFPTYQRFVYLNALYDISLSFEQSPLIGCTTFTVDGSRSTVGPLLARVFDFEVDDVFDRDKAVFIVSETDALSFLSVAWPGLVGVVSGMNEAGVAAVVHGARAGEPSNQGEPVVHAVRRMLGVATTLDEAIRALDERPAMISHLVIVMDASGAAAVLERAPGQVAHVRRLPALAVVTNHFEGPLSSDERNLLVRQTTSTLPRRRRGDALVAAAPPRVSPLDAATWLRDRSAADGAPLPPGDRRAIDADIATHGVVFDTRARVAWISRGPHLSGGFVRVSLLDELADERPPDERPAHDSSSDLPPR